LLSIKISLSFSTISNNGISKIRLIPSIEN
jgi:hypothetical protein